MDKLLQEILIFLESSKMRHHYCDDTWFSCPKEPTEGCADKNQKECNCGADEYNKKIRKLIIKIKHELISYEKK